MKNFMILTEAIQLIEEQLCQQVTRSEIAGHCHVSLSSLEKLFRYALHLSIGGYVERRRMTQAARDLAKSNEKITELAMKYQYNSVEVFSRAFRRVWNVNPSEFLDKWNFTGLFPRINFEYEEGEDLYMARKKVDISDAYDYLRERRGCYVLCFDMRNLMEINRISFKAGDLAILEMASRIDRAAGEDMLVMRIGGDEFALITGLYEIKEAQRLAEQILEKNGEAICFEEQRLPLSLWCGITKIPENLRYGEFFSEAHRAIMESKK